MSSESVYMVVNYTSSKADYFPNNKPEHFFIKFSKPLLLTEGRWKVALCEIEFQNVRKVEGEATPNHFEVDLAYCEGLLVHCTQTNCLRRIPFRRTGHVIYTSPFYVDIHSNYIDSCEIYIKALAEGKGQSPVRIKAYDDTCITVTLHFKKA